jgi:hypothetical protein
LKFSERAKLWSFALAAPAGGTGRGESGRVFRSSGGQFGKQKVHFNFVSRNSKIKTRNSPHLLVGDETHKIETISQMELIKFEVMIDGYGFLNDCDQEEVMKQER